MAQHYHFGMRLLDASLSDFGGDGIYLSIFIFDEACIRRVAWSTAIRASIGVCPFSWIHCLALQNGRHLCTRASLIGGATGDPIIARLAVSRDRLLAVGQLAGGLAGLASGFTSGNDHPFPGEAAMIATPANVGSVLVEGADWDEGEAAVCVKW